MNGITSDAITLSEEDLRGRLADLQGQRDRPTVPGRIAEIERLLGQLEAKRERERERWRQTRRQTREEAMRLARKDRSLPYINGREPSREAAHDARSHASNDRVRVLTLLLMRPYGMTWDNVADVLDLRPSTCRARIADLQELRLVVDSGRRDETDSGSTATVWVAWKHHDAQSSLSLEPAA